MIFSAPPRSTPRVPTDRSTTLQLLHPGSTRLTGSVADSEHPIVHSRWTRRRSISRDFDVQNVQASVIFPHPPRSPLTYILFADSCRSMSVSSSPGRLSTMGRMSFSLLLLSLLWLTISAHANTHKGHL